jgi:hypothetical protein
MFDKYDVYYSKKCYNNTIHGEYISSEKQSGGGGLDDWMNSISSIVNKKDMYDFAGDIQKKITPYTDFIVGKSNENINKKIYKWVTCPFIDGCEPDVTQFIYNYLNDDSINSDLLNMKSREKICENIAEIQDKIDSVFSELKLILPKNYFDSETYMNKYLNKYIKTTDS